MFWFERVGWVQTAPEDHPKVYLRPLFIPASRAAESLGCGAQSGAVACLLPGRRQRSIALSGHKIETKPTKFHLVKARFSDGEFNAGNANTSAHLSSDKSTSGEVLFLLNLPGVEPCRAAFFAAAEVFHIS